MYVLLTYATSAKGFILSSETQRQLIGAKRSEPSTVLVNSCCTVYYVLLRLSNRPWDSGDVKETKPGLNHLSLSVSFGFKEKRDWFTTITVAKVRANTEKR